jgi:N6-L-threonylcarbamoyladenine synthase
MGSADTVILGIESSCDDTAASIVMNGKVLANIVAGQAIHRLYGGVVPELAGRAHQANIVPVVDAALKKAGISKEQISAVAFTRGPGLMGSLLVGSSFAKTFALALNIPLIEVNHMQAHILAHFIDSDPAFPFICLTVSGGHTQIVLVKEHFDMQVLGETVDDAAGEAFDKAAKIMGLPYPGGPLIDKHAASGDPKRFIFPHPKTTGLNFSFSGLKTSFLNFVNENVKKDAAFIEKNRDDICASIQHTIVAILLDQLTKAARETGVKEIALAGGVSANSGLRAALKNAGEKQGWKIYIPAFEYCTDNAAMIAMTGFLKYRKKDFAGQDVSAIARYEIGS